MLLLKDQNEVDLDQVKKYDDADDADSGDDLDSSDSEDESEDDEEALEKELEKIRKEREEARKKKVGGLGTWLTCPFLVLRTRDSERDDSLLPLLEQALKSAQATSRFRYTHRTWLQPHWIF